MTSRLTRKVDELGSTARTSTSIEMEIMNVSFTIYLSSISPKTLEKTFQKGKLSRIAIPH